MLITIGASELFSSFYGDENKRRKKKHQVLSRAYCCFIPCFTPSRIQVDFVEISASQVSDLRCLHFTFRKEHAI